MYSSGGEISEVFPSFAPEKSVLKLLLEGLERNGNKVAQIEAATGKSYTFADILQRSKSIAVGLTKAGLVPGDYVVICCGKSSLAFAIQLGVMFTGGIPVLISDKSVNDICNFTKNHAIKIVFCDKVHLPVVKEATRAMSPKPDFIAADIDDSTMKPLIFPIDEFSLFKVKDNRKKVVLVLFTSGSTSDPKGVQITDLGVQRLGYSIADESIETYLLTNPFAWISSTISLVSSIFKGYSLILSDERDPTRQLKLIEKYNVNGWTVFAGTITLYTKQPDLDSINLSSLKVVTVGGAVVKKRTIEEFISKVLKRKIGLQAVYGMTEVGLITTWRDKDFLDLKKMDSSGYLAPGVKIKITDEQGSLVGPGEIGEIRAKTLSMTIGYWGRPELDTLSFDSDGFFRTGDAGYIDDDGFLYIVGRTSDIVTVKGSKVSVSEVADLVRTHPEVMDSAVLAKRHPDTDSDLIAFIVVRPGSHVREEDIIQYVEENAGKPIKLKAIYKLEEIPRTYSGKVHQSKLLSLSDKFGC